MTHTYTISGMTCNGCRTSIEERFHAVPGVLDVNVNLENGQAEIKMESHIPIDVFRMILPEKYAITEKKINDIHLYANGMSSEEPQSKQLFPLFLILGYITAASLLLNRNQLTGNAFMLDFMGLFYIVFSFFKILDVRGFSESFRMYDPLAKKFPVYGQIYPFLETALGIMFLMRIEIDMALFATLLLLGATTIGVTKVLLDKKSIQCACLGTALRLPMTKATFIENAVMIVMALLMLSQHFLNR